jgi:hypothetical protein
MNRCAVSDLRRGRSKRRGGSRFEPVQFFARSRRQVFHRFLRFVGGGEDRTRIVVKDFKPRRDVCGVILSWLICDPEHGAHECGTEFGNKFLERIGMTAEAIVEVAADAMRGTAPVRVMPISA